MTAPSLQAYIQGQGAASADNLNTFEQTCDTITQLRAFTGLPGMQVFAAGKIAINDGGGGVFRWSASATGPDDGINIILPTGSARGAWVRVVIGASSNVVRACAYTTLAQANSAAVAVNGALQIDCNITLTESTTITAKELWFTGGTITLGSFNLVGTGGVIAADPVQIFNFNGTGRLTGEWQHPVYYPEWNGVVGVEANNPSPFTAAATFLAANNAALQILEAYAAQSQYTVRVQFTKYMTAASGVTNPTPGLATIWQGISQKTTRIYAPDGNSIRVLTGTSAATNPQQLHVDLGLFCDVGKTAIAVDIINACFWELGTRCYVSQAAGAFRIQSASSGGFSENCGTTDIHFEFDCGSPYTFVRSGTGTGSMRGFYARGKNLWSRGSTSAATFITIGSACIPYNWLEINCTITNGGTGGNVNLFDNQSGQICNIDETNFDLETSGAGSTVTLATLAGSTVFSGSAICPSVYGSPPIIGKFIWAASLVAISTSRFINTGQYALESGAIVQTFTGTVTASKFNLITVAGIYVFDLTLRTQNTPAHFTARARLVVACDTGDGFAPQIISSASGVAILSNTSSIQNPAASGPFDLTNFAVDSATNYVTLTVTLGANVVAANGIVTMFGDQ